MTAAACGIPRGSGGGGVPPTPPRPSVPSVPSVLPVPSVPPGAAGGRRPAPDPRRRVRRPPPPAAAPDPYAGFEALRGLVDKERAGPAALGWDHRRMRRLLGRLGDPHLGMRCTLVAGSKGKGSTAVLLASVLAAAGRRTGLYTQPHLARYAERIRLAPPGGAPAELPPARTRALLDAVLRAAPGPVTAFEACTALALLSFAEEGADDAVVEVGFGGRLDACAECDPALVLFAPLEREHTDLLGPTLTDVLARDLALLRYGMRCRSVPQDPAVQALLHDHARAHGVDLAWAPPPRPLPDGRLRIAAPGGLLVDAALGLPGLYQHVNAALAAAGAEALGAGAPAVAAGLAAARWPGRFERVADRPTVLLDGAHTPASARALAASIAAAHPGRSAALVVGMLTDKDVRGFAEAISPVVGRVWAVAPAHPRAMAATLVAAQWSAALPDRPPAAVAPSVRAALARARSHVGADGLCVVAGSLHVVAEARALFRR